MNRLTCVMCLMLALPVFGDDAFAPNVEYNSDVPTLMGVVGHEPGARISSPSEIVAYARTLARHDPDRVRLIEYAKSWQGRPLLLLVISNKENMARLEENQQMMKQLAEPAGLDAALISSLVANTLPVSWMSFGVHGDEISSSDAALVTAYHLLAARSDKTVTNILANSIVVLDPSQNPDGRARFVEAYRQTRGLEPAIHPLAAEHLQPWPGGRYNHYMFDMNRDWFALTQPETRGRIRQYLKFQPVVHADVHEMGTDESYYFPPPADPFNPHITATQKDLLEVYGRNNAASFDRYGFDYFSREVFDAYYPGYGDTWPAFQGATGMTFEMASARGLAQLKSNGQVLTYRDGVLRHFVASMATLETTATDREKLLRAFTEFRQSAGSDNIRYLLAGGDPSLQHKLATLLIAQGVKVKALSKEARACGKSYPRGTIVVEAGQPAGRLVRTLMDADSPAGKAFWEAKEQDREKGLDLALYDVLAWSLPGLFNLDVVSCSGKVDHLADYAGATSPLKFGAAKIGYLVPFKTSASVQLLSHALREGLVVHHALKAFVLAGRQFEPGTLLVKQRENPTAYDTLRMLSAQYGVEIVPVDNSWTSEGISLGSSYVKQLVTPRIAIAWDDPVTPTRAGNLRYVIERQFGYPSTPVRTGHLRSRDLQYFNVLILPEGGDYAAELGESGMQNLKSWIENGGTLVTTGRASRLLLEDGLGLLATQLERHSKSKSKEKADDKKSEGNVPATVITSEQEYKDLVRSGVYRPDFIPGVLLRAEVNPDHWLAAGVAKNLNFMVGGSDVYTPLLQGSGTNLARFASADKLVAGGYLWSETATQMAHKPAVMTRDVGRGQVIAFVADPTFRGFMDGLHVIFANAVLRSGTYTRALIAIC